MAKAKRTGNKQPGDDPALEEAVEEAVETQDDSHNAVSINADLDPDKLHLHDTRSE